MHVTTHENKLLLCNGLASRLWMYFAGKGLTQVSSFGTSSCVICHNTWRHSTWLYLLELLAILRMEAGKAWEQGLAIQFNFCMKTNVRGKEGCVWWWRILSPFFVMSCQTGAFVRQVNCSRLSTCDCLSSIYLTSPHALQKQVGSFNHRVVAYKLERQWLWVIYFGMED